MIIEFLREGKIFEIDEGAVYTKCYNETLDSAIIRIENLDSLSRLDYVEPFDLVKLQHEDLGTIFMCVDTISEKMVNCTLDEEIYSYEISLFSQTKLLENIILPNLTITQREPKLSVYIYLQRYLDLYGPKILTSDGSYSNKWHFSQEVIDRFSAIDCPESQWNNPTLREVFNSLMMIDDCIPVLNNFEIGLLDLTEVKNDIKQYGNINYIQRSHSSQDYVSELYVDLKNVMQTKNEDVINTTTAVENVPFTSNTYLLTDDNVCLKTQFPILRIKKLVMHYYGQYEASTVQGTAFGQSHFKFDITDLCFEQKEWQTLKLRSKYDVSIDDDFKQYKNYTLYYNRGGNVIDNFAYLTTTWGLLADGATPTWKFLLLKGAKEALEMFYGTQGVSNVGIKGVDPEQIWFELEYETTGDCLFKASKTLPTKNNRMVTDNQSFSYVDAYSQGLLEYMKANRLGNKMLHINQTKRNENEDFIKLADKYEDNIVYQVQYQIYKDHIEVNAQATKDYILRDYFTGVEAKIRSWKIVDGAEATTRNELIKNYLEFSFVKKDDVRLNLIELDAYDFLSPFFDYVKEPVIYGALKPYAEVSQGSSIVLPGVNETYASELINRLVGNSIVLTFGAEDNYTWQRGMDRVNYADEGGTVKPLTDGGVLLNDFPYVNENGEMESCTVRLNTTINFDFAYVSPVGFNFVEQLEPPQYTDLDKQKAVGQLVRRPIIPLSYIEGNDVFVKDCDFYKDNREILKLSLQFEFCSDTSDIAFTENFLQNQKMVKTIDNDGDLKFYLSDSSNYNFRRLSIPSNSQEITGVGLSRGRVRLGNLHPTAVLHIQLSNSFVTTDEELELIKENFKNKTLYIEKDGKLLFAVNNFSDYITTEPVSVSPRKVTPIFNEVPVLKVYLNIITDRDMTVYDVNDFNKPI